VRDEDVVRVARSQHVPFYGRERLADNFLSLAAFSPAWRHGFEMQSVSSGRL
jgi:hypothetical protein